MKRLVLILTIIILIFIISTCAITGNTSVSVSPVIKAIGLPSSSDITSVELTVSGPGMNTISIVYDSLPSSIDLLIPSGSDRTFELDVFVDLPIVSAKSYKGTATADLTQDSTTIYLTMGVGSTKIVVPDYQNNRILQFDDISDTTSIALGSVSNPVFGAWLTTNSILFNPYDIEIDSQGRIYIANYDFGGSGGVIRVDDITGLNPVIMGTGNGAIQALTIDQQNKLLYYTDRNNIYSSNLDGTNEIQLSDIGGEWLQGLFIDNGSFLYVAERGGDGPAKIIKYSISQMTTVDNTELNIIDPWDVMVKDNILYVTNPGGGNGNQILGFSTSDLSLFGHYGNFVGGTWAINTEKGNFYGPRRFAAQLNGVIIIVDESDSAPFDKLIQMNNINGDNWLTFPENEDGQNHFRFFYDSFA